MRKFTEEQRRAKTDEDRRGQTDTPQVLGTHREEMMTGTPDAVATKLRERR